ncbi:hypothetical protein FRB90_011405 [Tulasnella sp. 427]|nr:hypothetical protein FRB90_011405 [Tulasnella sp. 427]
MGETDHRDIERDESEVQIRWPGDGLPTDLFITILLNVLTARHFDPLRDRPTALARLLQLKDVNSSWSQIIDATPVLWTFLSYENSSSHTDLALERSDTARLSIICRRSWDTPRMASFIAKIIPHAERWKNVEVDDYTWMLVYPVALPNLEAFNISGNYRDQDARLSPALLGEDCKSLRHLTLNDVIFTGDRLPNVGQSLRSLTIQRLGDRISHRQIYNLLLQHPHLLDVHIEIYSSPSTNSTVEPLSELILPELRSCRITSRSRTADSLISLIRALKAPNCTSFWLYIPDPVHDFFNILNATSPHFTQIIPKIGSGIKLDINFGLGFNISLTGVESRGQETRGFVLYLPGTYQETTIKWLSSLFVQTPPPVTYLTIKGIWSSEKVEQDLVTALVATRRVAELHLKDTPLGMWKLLGRPASRQVGLASESWLLPDLERLVVDEYRPTRKYDDALVAAIQAREAARIETRKSGSQMQGYPIPLTSLLYRTAEREKDGRLTELLGNRYAENNR